MKLRTSGQQPQLRCWPEYAVNRILLQNITLLDRFIRPILHLENHSPAHQRPQSMPLPCGDIQCTWSDAVIRLRSGISSFANTIK